LTRWIASADQKETSSMTSSSPTAIPKIFVLIDLKNDAIRSTPAASAFRCIPGTTFPLCE
jgi:hypothetical protein